MGGWYDAEAQMSLYPGEEDKRKEGVGGRNVSS
jgi:hypothetical protein